MDRISRIVRSLGDSRGFTIVEVTLVLAVLSAGALIIIKA